MILERLIELRNRLADDPESGLTPAYHKRQKVKWVMEISEAGKFVAFLTTGEKKKEIKEFDTAYKKRTAAPDPYLFVDKREYVLGDGDDPKTATRHQLYKSLIRECAATVDHNALNAYLNFLESEEELQRAREEATTKEIGDSELLLPAVEGLILSNLAAPRRFWQEREDNAAGEKSSLEAECMVCGMYKAIARTHPVELLVGADRVALVTGNAQAFLSYGLSQSEIAPMCQTCARSYGEGLVWLLKNDANRIRINDVTWVFWTREPVEFNFASILTDPSPEDVRELLLAPQKGRRPSIEGNRFYALALSSNKSRLIVRNWMSVSLPEVEYNLAAYFQRQEVMDRNGNNSPIKLVGLAASMVRELKELPPQVLPILLNHALLGTPLPLSLLQRALGRARAERENVMTRPRAALIKMVLLSNSYSHEDIMPVLNPDHPNPAYHCGRLLALLDDVQRVAVGAKATLIDRYYGSASSTPATVFGSLLRSTQNHLGKLRKTKPGLHYFFDQALGDVISHIQEFPKTLTLPEQGLFALGFYQQKHHKKVEAPELEEAPDAE